MDELEERIRRLNEIANTMPHPAYWGDRIVEEVVPKKSAYDHARWENEHWRESYMLLKLAQMTALAIGYQERFERAVKALEDSIEMLERDINVVKRVKPQDEQRFLEIELPSYLARQPSTPWYRYILALLVSTVPIAVIVGLLGKVFIIPNWGTNPDGSPSSPVLGMLLFILVFFGLILVGAAAVASVGRKASKWGGSLLAFLSGIVYTDVLVIFSGEWGTSLKSTSDPFIIKSTNDLFIIIGVSCFSGLFSLLAGVAIHELRSYDFEHKIADLEREKDHLR